MSQLKAFWADWLNAQNMVERDVESTIFRYSPFNYPLSTILTNIAISDEFWWWVKSTWINKTVINSYKHEFVEKTPVTAKTLLATAVSDATTSTFDVTAWEAWKFLVNDVLRVIDASDATNRVTEQVLVVAVDTVNDKITVTRWFWSAAALSSIDAWSKLVKVSTAFWEASSAPATRIEKAETKEAYLQLFRTSVNVSEEALDQQLVAWKAWSDEYAEKKINHAIDIETALWFWEWWFKVIDWKEWYLMKWIVPELREFDWWSLVETVNWTLTETALYSFLRRWFAFWSQKKILFASWVVQDAIAQFWKESRRIWAWDKNSIFWLNITEYVTPNWTIQVVQNPVFTEDYWFENWAVLLDVAKSCTYMVHKNWSTEFNEHNQVNWEMKRSWDFRTRCWLKFWQLKNNRLLYLV